MGFNISSPTSQPMQPAKFGLPNFMLSYLLLYRSEQILSLRVQLNFKQRIIGIVVSVSSIVFPYIQRIISCLDLLHILIWLLVSSSLNYGLYWVFQGNFYVPTIYQLRICGKAIMNIQIPDIF
jgi:hypothetical protein